MTRDSKTTIGDFLRALSPSLARRKGPPSWPPDAFALAAALLNESGAYLAVVQDWPPRGSPKEGSLDVAPKDWAKKIEKVGEKWRRAWNDERLPPPEIRAWWRLLRDHDHLEITEVRRSLRVAHALLHLCAAADEASFDAGLPVDDEGVDRFWVCCNDLLTDEAAGATLCASIDRSRVRVLPKCHTPQTGITLRSLSHHLALWQSGHVVPRWFTVPWDLVGHRGEVDDPSRQTHPIHSLNLLLAPWPKIVSPIQFEPALPRQGPLRNMDPSFGFFNYRAARADTETDVADELGKLYDAARAYTDHVDVVVLPELALGENDYKRVREKMMARGSMLVAGVGRTGQDRQPGCNRVAIDVPISEKITVSLSQNKHHRWRLDHSQIVRYGLGAQLDPMCNWWEYADPAERCVAFVVLFDWLSLCVLICEDLARLDPIASLVRAVGPNLVIALLMDGPQLPARWSARYATVLAEDPGSSVLTLTSLGMCSLSRPPGKSPSRAIALWKDARSDTVQLDLPAQADGLLLNLVRRYQEEWTADGRRDYTTAGYPILGGVHPVCVAR